jgi:hypothetical protein
MGSGMQNDQKDGRELKGSSMADDGKISAEHQRNRTFQKESRMISTFLVGIK